MEPKKAIILLVALLFVLRTDSYPTVLMHGITANIGTVSHVGDVLRKYFPTMYIKAVEIGDGKVDSLFWNIERQVQSFCDQLANDTLLRGGINLIGFSQGGIITRTYLERCNNPPVVNYISWVSPQGGQFGVPSLDNISSDILEEIFDCCAYDSGIQDLFSFANYWRDPFQLANYKEYCRTLPDIDNERGNNPQYKKNILNLKSFVYSYSVVDLVLKPKETGWFGVFAPNDAVNIVPLEDRLLWKNDLIGLRTLNETGRLHRFSTTCEHQDYFTSCFDSHFIRYVIPHLQ